MEAECPVALDRVALQFTAAPEGSVAYRAALATAAHGFAEAPEAAAGKLTLRRLARGDVFG